MPRSTLHALSRTMRFTLLILAVAAGASLAAAEPEVLLVWPGGAPGSEGKTGRGTVRVTDGGENIVTDVHEPTLTVYLPPSAQATGAGIVVMPGGGHRELWTDHEGHNVARWLSARGIAAFVLYYRLANVEGSTYSVRDHALADAQRASRLVRASAAKWNVDPARVGVMGFSAGGEVAALAARHFDEGDANAPDPVARFGCKPAFQVLVYPGRSQNIDPVADSPPALLVCGYNDRKDISEGLAEVYLKFKRAGVSAELHIYAEAGHGFGQRERNAGPAGRWLDRTHEWMEAQGFLGADRPDAGKIGNTLAPLHWHSTGGRGSARAAADTEVRPPRWREFSSACGCITLENPLPLHDAAA